MAKKLVNKENKLAKPQEEISLQELTTGYIKAFKQIIDNCYVYDTSNLSGGQQLEEMHLGLQAFPDIKYNFQLGLINGRFTITIRTDFRSHGIQRCEKDWNRLLEPIKAKASISDNGHHFTITFNEKPQKITANTHRKNIENLEMLAQVVKNVGTMNRHITDDHKAAHDSLEFLGVPQTPYSESTGKPHDLWTIGADQSRKALTPKQRKIADAQLLLLDARNATHVDAVRKATPSIFPKGR